SATVQAQVSTQQESITAPLSVVKKAPFSDNELKRWSHLDLIKDSIPGMSVDKAYKELLQGKTGQKVIVGIVDSGVDIEHEDLKGKIWTNPKEIPGNGIDDDGNGYVDDVHGWNFLGSVDENGNPINIGATTLEVTREMVRMERLASERELTPQEETYLAKLEKEVAAGRERVAAQEKKTGRPGPRYYDPSFDPRREIIGDDPADFS